MTLDFRHYKAMLLAVLIVVGAGLQCGRSGVTNFTLTDGGHEVITAQTGGGQAKPAPEYVVIEVIFEPVPDSEMRLLPGHGWVFGQVPVLFFGAVIKFSPTPAGHEPWGRVL